MEAWIDGNGNLSDLMGSIASVVRYRVLERTDPCLRGQISIDVFTKVFDEMQEHYVIGGYF